MNTTPAFSSFGGRDEVMSCFFLASVIPVNPARPSQEMFAIKSNLQEKF